MREMKDSGIEWLGEIDKEFNVAPLKFFLEKGKDSIKTGPFGSQLSGSDFLSEPSDYWVYNQRSVIDNNFRDGLAFISQEKFESMIGFQVSSNDILITTRGTIGKINRIPEKFNKGIIHPCIIKFRINEELINYKLLRYIFNESDFISRQIHYKSNATTIDVIYSDTLKNILIPICDLKRQNIICTKLETICLKVDTLIANQQSQIEKLKSYKQSLITEVVTKGLNKNVPMKDSGVEWIGEIASTFSVQNIRSLFQIRKDIIGHEPETVLSITQNGIKIKDISENSGQMANSYANYQIVHIGDFAMNHMDLLTGGIGISEYEGVTSPDYRVFELRHAEMNSRYFLYIFESYYRNKIFYAFGQGAANLGRWRLPAKNFYSTYIPVAPIKEQNEIVEYLDKKLSQIDSLISLKQQKIEKLQQYKKSLIYEYVTGKKEVK